MELPPGTTDQDGKSRVESSLPKIEEVKESTSKKKAMTPINDSWDEGDPMGSSTKRKVKRRTKHSDAKV